MSKKSKAITEEVEVVTANTTPENAQEVKSKPKKEDKKVKTDKKTGKDNKKDKKKKENKVAKKTKETVSELKKVVWPTFPEVVKRTGVVLVVVIIFAIVLFGIDLLLGFLSSTLMGNTYVPFG